MPVVKMPDGAQVSFPDDMPREQIRDMIAKKYPEVATQQPAQAQQASQPSYQGGMFKAATEGSHAGAMFGFDDELTAGMLAPIDAAIDWFKGDGFDMGKAYTRKQQMLDQQKQARREEYPVTSIAGELAGGLALGGGAAKAGLSLAAKPAASMAKRIGAGAVEGAGYGALYGAGEAKPGERMEGAGKGAAYGGIIGGGIGGVGGAMARRAGNKSLPVAPSSDDLAAQSRALYDEATQAGITVKPESFDKVINNVMFVAGRLNKDLRPNTAGIVDDVMALRGQPVTLEQLDELRQVVGQSMKRAQPQDIRTLERIKSVIDGFADNAKPGDISGDVAGFGKIKEARALWAKKAKTERIEQLLDFADVDVGQYTQSGMANAIRKRMDALYKQIAKGQEKGFTREEVALIRKMAKGGSNSQMVNWLAKFAPRGVVSSVLGVQLGGPAGLAVPAVGAVAGRMADKGAMGAATALRDAAARGFVPQMPQLPNKLMPLIPGTIEASTGALRTR